MKRKRPWFVIELAIDVLAFSLYNGLRAGSALYQQDFLSGLSLPVPPLYLILSGAVWALAGLILVVGLWFGHRLAPSGVKVLAWAFAVVHWFEQIVLMRSPLRDTNWLFSGIITVILLLLVHLIFLWPGVKAFFGVENERKPQDRRTT